MKIVNANRIEKPEIQYCKIKNIDDFNLTDILKFINTEGSKKDLFPCVTKILLNRIGINQKNSIVLVKKDKIVAFAGLVDQRKWKQFILTNYSWTLKFIRPIFNLYARNFKYISIPAIGTPVNSPTVTLFVVKNNNPELEKELLYAISQETKSRQSDIFTIATITGSSIDQILNTKYNLSIKNDLYMVGKKAGEKKLLYIDALMLY